MTKTEILSRERLTDLVVKELETIDPTYFIHLEVQRVIRQRIRQIINNLEISY